MLRALSVASLAAASLMVAGCAHAPVMKQEVNRAAKADKYVTPKKMAPVEMPTPNQVVKKRWQWPDWLRK